MDGCGWNEFSNSIPLRFQYRYTIRGKVHRSWKYHSYAKATTQEYTALNWVLFLSQEIQHLQSVLTSQCWPEHLKRYLLGKHRAVQHASQSDLGWPKRVMSDNTGGINENMIQSSTDNAHRYDPHLCQFSIHAPLSRCKYCTLPPGEG